MNQNLKLGIALLPQLLPAGWASPSRAAAIVIDTLRFTSTACIALDAGAAGLHVLSNIELARDLARTSEPAMLLCGERHCIKIPGFDLGNSPFEYGAATVCNRQLIFSTTNGTVAVEAVQSASPTALGSLLNRQAVADWLSRQSVDQAWIVCAGTDGQVAQEDVLTAGAILERLHRLGNIEHLNDSAQLALNAWHHVQRENCLLEELRMARGGRNLIESGFAEDVEFAARLDSLNCVPLRTINSADSSIAKFERAKQIDN